MEQVWRAISLQLLSLVVRFAENVSKLLLFFLNVVIIYSFYVSGNFHIKLTSFFSVIEIRTSAFQDYLQEFVINI